jgi:anti-sigma B factor antagonist
MKQLLDVHAKAQGDVPVVVATGDVDLATTPKLAGMLNDALESRPRLAVVDLTGVGFLGSVGIAALVHAIVLTKSRGGELRVVVEHSSPLNRVLAITGVTPDVMDVFPTLRAALEGA